jgi:DNA primase
MTNLNVRILAAAIGRPARLRADRIRRDTLTRLAAALAEDHDSDVINAIDALVDAMKHDAPDVEVDALVADIEDVADMGRSVMDLAPGDVQQLAMEAAAAVNERAAALGTVTALPGQREGGAAA